VERSPEVEAVVRRIWDSANRRDFDTLRSLTSKSDDVRSIGQSEDHWWQGFEAVTRQWEVATQEVDAVRVEHDYVEAFESGNVAWAAGKATIVTSAGDRFPQRYTCVLELESGTWRCVQWHSSKAVPSMEAWGVEMTATLEDLVGSIDETASHELDQVSPTGTVTIVFTDIEGSTALSRSMRDADWADTIDRHFETVRQVVEQYGGTVIKTLGDGAMAAFHGAEVAVQAAIGLQQRMQELDLSVRIGVHTGDVERLHGDYFGVTVSKAARVTSAASGREILTSSITAGLVADSGFMFGPERLVELKGLEGTHRLIPIDWKTVHNVSRERP
jgi:class 3 adenylate cyclase